jgi:hypothetical protein
VVDPIEREFWHPCGKKKVKWEYSVENSFFAKKNKTVNYWEIFGGKYFVTFLQLIF